jgi:hypothetical protein
MGTGRVTHTRKEVFAMTRHLMNRCGVCLVIALALFGLPACSNDDGPVAPSKDTAPTIPDASTMTLDLAFFDPAPVDRASLAAGAPLAVESSTGKDNFINAAVRVYYVELVFWAALQPPVSAFALAIHSVPQLQDDGSWLWTYIYVDGAIEYRIFLNGKNAGDRTEWRMEVSTNNPAMPLEHFVWFTGEAMKDETSGYWQFYEPVIDPAMAVAGLAGSSASEGTPGIQSIRIDWLNGPGLSHRLTVTNNTPGGADEGDRVVFSDSFEASCLEFTDVSVPAVYNVTWYRDGSGSIQVPDYKNGEKACWDTRQNDTVCP